MESIAFEQRLLTVDFYRTNFEAVLRLNEIERIFRPPHDFIGSASDHGIHKVETEPRVVEVRPLYQDLRLDSEKLRPNTVRRRELRPA